MAVPNVPILDLEWVKKAEEAIDARLKQPGYRRDSLLGGPGNYHYSIMLPEHLNEEEAEELRNRYLRVGWKAVGIRWVEATNQWELGYTEIILDV
jgi:hypothetical protein